MNFNKKSINGSLEQGLQLTSFRRKDEIVNGKVPAFA